ncbi:PREDICTED: leukocyte immunoglobulin-like receptor subfamily A member 6 [Dipodomys ordii]|uniref:Natural cytotoxicity triggering receptor 1 n=1 Tax=Dipodomys ordii TaxID=10020 RepID=A0A1S3G2R5_DIPOR|nr:PREDICTED: leukocyte immunoglobulin-like receptor subfamily A member 6 [Dipodomys ordii]
MALALAALLYIGLSVDSAAQGQGGSLPRPVLRAEPSSVVAQGSAVTLWCKRAWKSQKFHLYKGDKYRWALKIPGTPGKRTAFFMWAMTKDNAGRYFCFYLSPAGWSDHSEPSRVVVTENTSNSFTLPSEPDSRPKCPTGDHTAQNLLRLGLALLVLVALVWLLAEDWLSRKKHRLELQAGDVGDGRQLGGPGTAHDLMVPDFHLNLRRLPWPSRWHYGRDGRCPIGLFFFYALACVLVLCSMQVSTPSPWLPSLSYLASSVFSTLSPWVFVCSDARVSWLRSSGGSGIFPTPPYPVHLGQAEPSVCQAPHWPGSPWAMPSTLPALLWAGLCLSQIGVHTQTLSKPTIQAIPSHLVPVGSRVEIWCQGVRGAVEYQLHFEGGLHAVERPKSPRSESNARFLISVVSQGSAGQYRCLYWSGELWSEYSDLLDLVVTGLYDTPTLSVHPGPEVAMGEPVTFRCQLDMATNTFFLMKEGWPSPEQLRFGNLQAEFPMGPATRSHRGTYRCFGSYNNHLWSFPSNPVRLEVTGDVGNTSFAPTNPPTSSPGPWQAFNSIPGWGLQQDFTPGDHTAQNLLRLGLALLVLVALAWLLAGDRISRKKAQAGAVSWGRSRWQTARRPWMDGRSRGAQPGGEAGTLSCLSCDGQTEGGTAGNGEPSPGVGLEGVPCPCP